MKFGLSEETIIKINHIFANYEEVSEAILYGSRAKGDHKTGSDIDLTLKGDNLNLKILNKIDNDLDDLLLPYNFDLSIYSQIDNQNLKEHIQRVGQPFYSRKT